MSFSIVPFEAKSMEQLAALTAFAADGTSWVRNPDWDQTSNRPKECPTVFITQVTLTDEGYRGEVQIAQTDWDALATPTNKLAVTPEKEPQKVPVAIVNKVFRILGIFDHSAE